MRTNALELVPDQAQVAGSGCADCGNPTGRHFARYCDACRWKHRGRANHVVYAFTAERRAYLETHYSPTAKGCSGRIARVFNVPVWRVKRWANELGLSTPTSKSPDWTEEEVEFLESHIGSRHVNWIARRLGRSITAVVVKAKRLEIDRRGCRDWYTAHSLSAAFGVDPTTVAHWVRKGWLKAERFGQDHQDGRPCAYKIAPPAVRRFVRKHPNAYVLAKVDQIWFLDLVFGRVGEETS